VKLIFIILCIISINILEAKNALMNETSPYLQQHADNPVNWYPWGDAAFAKAKKEGKKIFLSIGYSTCHWCHVMEKESFTNKGLAEIFNRYYVAIKVDKEEMPHLDQHFQNLHKKYTTRVGGWPLSVIMDTEENIYYIGTYIPPKRKSYSEGLDTLLLKYATTHKLLKPKTKISQNKNSLDIASFQSSITKQYDKIYGGFSRGKKFPEVSKLQLMLHIAQLQNNQKLYDNFYQTLDVMALRGLYDHIEGGFYRYCVDAAWEIPHFEKMLYTQAQMVDIYTQGYNHTEKELYKKIVVETIAMLEMRFTKNSLYMSASDADGDSKEGYYFTFTPKEVELALKNNPHKELLEEESELCFFGNFDGRVHLNFYGDQRPKGFEALRRELLLARKKKHYPFIDEKINTTWNSMMIVALYKAATIDKHYATLAQNHLDALTKMMFVEGELYHQGIIGTQVKQKALLEDYSFMIAALLAGYEFDYDTQKLHFAEYLFSQAREKFYKDGIWFASHDALHIVADINDKHYKSTPSQMVENLLKLASLKSSFRYQKIAQSSLDILSKKLQKDILHSPALADDYLAYSYQYITLKSSQKNLQRHYKEIAVLPYPYIVTKKEDFDDWLGCTMGRCFFKEHTFEKVKEGIKKQY
jgi:uncharacterized protein YyaL (SSP411 family)